MHRKTYVRCNNFCIFQVQLDVYATLCGSERREWEIEKDRNNRRKKQREKECEGEKEREESRERERKDARERASEVGGEQ